MTAVHPGARSTRAADLVRKGGSLLASESGQLLASAEAVARGNVARPSDLPDFGQRPVQAVDDPVLSSPYEEPREHWIYTDGVPSKAPGRRPASYYYRTRPGRAEGRSSSSRRSSGTTLPLVNRAPRRR